MLELAALLSLAVIRPQVPAADTTVVRGTVFDSIAARPLVGAAVQLVRADPGSTGGAFAATTDSAGRFIVRGVPPGRYVAGFFHPTLDTLGLELRERVIDVGANGATVGLAIPSSQTLVRGFCGDSSSTVLPTLLFGTVRDARTESAVESASVAVDWVEPTRTAGGLGIVERSGQTTTRRAGFFALCGLPIDAALSVRIARTRDTAVVSTRIPSHGVLHLTLFMGAAGTTGRIAGRITDRMKRPVLTARVTAGGREAPVNAAGRFLLDSVPTGSQSMDVRSIGYAPVSVVVSVTDGQAANADVTLERIVTLPTTESRASAASDHLAQYLHTKRTDPTDARFIEPSRLPGYPATQSVCALVSILRGTSMCLALEACDAFFLNGTRVVYKLTDVDADDILGVEVFGSHWPAVYDAYRRIRAPMTCGIVVFTRCPGVDIRCGDNPASQTIRRPESRGLRAE